MPLTRLTGAASALILLSLTACAGQSAADEPAASGDPITITHTQGQTTLQGPAQRIVVLDLGALDTLRALGAEDSVVGLTKGAALPAALADFDDDRYADVGTVKEPDLEAIAALDPDLVIAGFRTAGLVEELSRNFPTIDVTYDATAMTFYEGIEYSTTVVAQTVGKEAAAADELAEVQEALDAAQEKAPAGDTAMILMTSGGKVSAQGTGSRFGLVHTELGLEPAISDVEVEAHGEAISFEAIAEADPDHLYVVDRDAAIGQESEAAEQVLDNDLVAGTTAWSQDNVTYLDGGRWYIMIHGVDNAVEMLNEAVSAF
ncbi:siderophore ABC transporter substrate-binding protein [Tessaracoccus sp. Z1128]